MLPDDKDFLLTRNNMVVQSCGRSLLEVVIVLTKYWCKQFGIDATLVCTIHDSLLYECKENQYMELCAIMQMAHIYCWGFLREELGIREMGLSGSFFDSFEVGPFLRKAWNQPTTTPFNKENHPNHTLVTAWDTFDQIIKMF